MEPSANLWASVVVSLTCAFRTMSGNPEDDAVSADECLPDNVTGLNKFYITPPGFKKIYFASLYNHISLPGLIIKRSNLFKRIPKGCNDYRLSKNVFSNSEGVTRCSSLKFNKTDVVPPSPLERE